MPIHALIIAIENYPNVGALGTFLPGTRDSAVQFFNWLRDAKGVSPENVLWVSDSLPPWPVGTPGWSSPATVDGLVKALDRLITIAMDTTEQLYVLFSGHGYHFTDRGGRSGINLLLAQDIAPVVLRPADRVLASTRSRPSCVCRWGRASTFILSTLAATRSPVKRSIPPPSDYHRDGRGCDSRRSSPCFPHVRGPRQRLTAVLATNSSKAWLAMVALKSGTAQS